VIPLQHGRLIVSGGELAFVDVGEGPPVLLLHGFPTSSFLWRREVWLLAQRMRVIAPDLLGYGQSDRPADRDLSESAQAGYLQELLETLGIVELAVVGHEMGGDIAQMLALEGGLDVRVLVLLDSGCFDAGPSAYVRELQSARSEQESAEFVASAVRRAFDIGVAHRERMDDQTLQSYVQPWASDPPSFFRAVRAITGRGVAGRERDLAALGVPALIMWGEDDPFLGSELAERLGDSIPWSTVALLPGCSHFVTEDAPHTVGPLIYEYLRARYLGDQHGHPISGPMPASLEER
jgi:2-hydroxymuconate-semialdehyde hydrolase